MKRHIFRTPTRPYSITDAFNRVAAATGSVRFATEAAHADYNGHHINVYFNDYRKYWVADYTWAGRNVIARGTLEQCLKAALRVHERGALGSSVSCGSRDETEDALCRTYGLLPSAEADVEDAKWRDDRYDEVAWAMKTERDFGVPAITLLINANSAAEYKKQLNEVMAECRAKGRI